VFKEDQGISYGYENNLPKWRVRRRSLHQATKSISIVRKGRLCFQVEEITAWSQASPHRLLLKVGHVFSTRNIDNNLYIKVDQDSILIIEVYVDEISFGRDDDRMSQKFAKDMQDESKVC
jgi:hypothetical protein